LAPIDTSSTHRPLLQQPNIKDPDIERRGEIANLLNKANVGNILWGSTLLAAYTIPTLYLVSSQFMINQQEALLAIIQEHSFLVATIN
jgi:hypothetical protein